MIENTRRSFVGMGLLVDSMSGFVIGGDGKPGPTAPGVATGEVFVSLL